MRGRWVALAGVGLALASPAYAVDLDNVCRHAPDRNDRVAACGQVIDTTRDRKTLLRAYNTRGLALCTLKRCAEAVKDFEAVLRMDSSIAGYFDNYARSLRDAGRFDEALAAENRAIRMAPTYAFVYYGKAKIIEAQGNPSDALTVLNDAIRVEPNNAGLWEYRGKLLGLLARYPGAYAAFDRALSIDPKRAHVFITRADVESTQGNTDAALADLRRYPQGGDDYEEAQQKIAELNEPPATITVPVPDAPAPQDQSAVEQAQKEATAAQERAARVEAEAEALRQLNAAHQREKEAADAKAAAEGEAKEAADKAAAEEDAKKKAVAETRRQEDARKKAESEPINILTAVDAEYVIVKRCHEKRDGYATVWINDTELDRGRQEMKTIENKLKEANGAPSLDTSAAWAAANERADRVTVLDDTACHDALDLVDQAFKKADPHAAMTKKDF